MALALNFRVLLVVFSAEAPNTGAKLEELLFFNLNFLILVFSPLVESDDRAQSAHLVNDVLILSHISTLLLTLRGLLLLT